MNSLAFRKTASCLLFALFLLSIPENYAFAQGFGGVKNAFIDMKPKYPLAGERVNVTLNAPSLDMDTALVVWTINGKVVQSAYAGKNFSFTAGNIGERMIIQVSAEDGAQKKVSAQKELYISDLVLVWEGKTYTPPFYKGRSLSSPGSYTVLSAIASVTKKDGGVYGKNELFYVWKTGNTDIPNISGKGKHSVLMKNGNPYEPYDIYLEVKDPTGEVRVVKKIVVPISQPTVHLYEDNLYGIYYDQIIGSVYGVYGGEATVVAEPYFMSASSRIDPALSYSWVVGDTNYTSPGSLTFGTEGDGYGSTHLNLVIKNLDYRLQSARSDKRIDFGGNNPWLDTNPETTTL